MMQRLSPWQRFWGMFALVFLVSAVVMIVSTWPRHDAAIVADLRAPECQQWRGMTDAGDANVYPEPGVPCRAIRLFDYDHHLVLHTEADYDSFLLKARARTVLLWLGVWAGFSGFLFLLGLFSARVVMALLGRGRGRGSGQAG